jgi:large-conductance mechanosensitive channel
MNWNILIPVGVVLVALIVFMVLRNIKDEKKFEKQLNEDYHKSKDEEGDAEIDEVTH